MVREVDRVKDGFRHEYKFLISRSSADLLKLRLPCVMKRDDHAGPTGEYISIIKKAAVFITIILYKVRFFCKNT